jgi:starvation-inducible DNA-binding protein
MVVRPRYVLRLWNQFFCCNFPQAAHALPRHNLSDRDYRSTSRSFDMATADTKARQTAALKTPTDIKSNAAKDVSAALNALLADMFALYLKTMNFHWHVSGPHFYGLHLMFDEQSEQILATTDDLAERVRKLGNTTLRSTGHVGRLQRISDNDAAYVTPQDMLAELREDNLTLVQNMRETHELCDESKDVATASLLENWIDEAEKRIWFLFESGRRTEG